LEENDPKVRKKTFECNLCDRNEAHD